MFGKKLKRRYLEDDSGQIAVITAVVAVPLMIGVSVALDSHMTDRARVQLQASLDNAAIAAISDQTITMEERIEHAKERFWSNMSSEEQVKFAVPSSTDSRIDVQGTMQVNTLFAGIVGRDTVTFKADSAAEIVKGSTVCMLALDPDSNRAFEVTTGGQLHANCAIQVNSVSDVASVVDHGGIASAESFCVGGKASGLHTPFVNTECATLSDPYENVEIPGTILPCTTLSEIKELRRDWRSSRDAVDTHNASVEVGAAAADEAGVPYDGTTFEKLRLKPGNYCGGLFLMANEFVLDPGEYHITGGDLTFRSGTELTGADVTFILHENAKLEIGDGSVLNLKGPVGGPLDGLVFAQNLKDKSIYNPNYPNVESTILGGSKLDILGTVYLPSHKIMFLEGSGAISHAPATSFISHQISVSLGANISVSTDHIAAGISPIKPRSDGGVRLVR